MRRLAVLFSLLLLCNIVPQLLNAQVSLSPYLSMLNTAGGAKKVNLFGAGAAVKYQLQQQLQLELDLSLFPAQKNSEQPPFVTLDYTNSVAAAELSLNYLLLKPGAKLNPFIGIGTGISIAKQELTVSGAFTKSEYSQSNSGFTVSPRAGLNFALSNKAALLFKIQYVAATVGSKSKTIGYTVTGEPVVLAPVSSYIKTGLGITVTL